MTTLERLLPIMRMHALADVATITPESRLIHDLHLDSLDRYDLACDILEEFKVDIPDDKMMGAVTVSDVVALIDEALAVLPARGTA